MLHETCEKHCLCRLIFAFCVLPAFNHRPAQSSSLLALDLSGNRVDDDGARCLATLVAAAACPLAHLAFGDNPIGIEGGITLAGALGANRSLRSLSMRGGVQAAFPAEVAVELLRNLGRHPLLRQARVGGCAWMDAEGAMDSHPIMVE